MSTVYCFAIYTNEVNQYGSLNVRAIACDKSGRFITEQISSTPEWARYDLIEKPGDFHQWFYSQRYPDGYELAWLDDGPPDNWDGVTGFEESYLMGYHKANNTDVWRSRQP